ncbi:MAG: cyanophycin synthetase [Schumannella sp.]|nr:cyanophycin synthetase [Schumannella sp.]
MRILETAVYRGPHLYSRTPMVRIQLDLGTLAERDSAHIPDFAARLTHLLPGLHRHHCSTGRPGGFVERLHDGTLLGHVVEHVALELQAGAGMPATRGKTRAVRGHEGVYDVMFAYEDDQVALLAGRIALQLVDGLLPPGDRGIERLDVVAAPPAVDADEAIPGLGALHTLAARRTLGPTTRSLVEEARRRRIPVQRIDDQSLVRLGQGVNQRSFRAGITDATSHLAVQTAGSKQQTKARLRAAGIPVPDGTVVTSAAAAMAAARDLGGSVVIKPLAGNHGRGVSRGLHTSEQISRGFDLAAQHGPQVIVEREIVGADHRILVIGGRVIAAAERVPAQVTGDGVSTISQLIDALNRDPRRGAGHANVLTRVVVDQQLGAVLGSSGRSLDTVPQSGEVVVLRDTANLSTGGEAIDRTDELHPDNIAVAERAARAIGLDIAGIDVIAPDLSRPFRDTGGAIIEVNAAPGFRMHLAPSQGMPRDVARPAIDLLYPPGAASRIPITAVTGTNGKSTTVRMIAHLLQTAGRRVGMTTTSGITVDGTLVKAVDASGPRSARMVLNDPTVDAAVLETARGGMLREGLAYDLADVGLVLNVTADHLGIRGIDTLRQLARLKSLVVRNVRRRGTCVLNADDPLTRRMAAVARGRVSWFTVEPLTLALRGHLADGGTVVALEPSDRGGLLVLREGRTQTPLLHADEMPATFGGIAAFNISNALAAVAAARGHGIAVETIVEGLRSFQSSYEQNPGRFNLTDAPGFTTIVDYAHNPAALRALGAAVKLFAARSLGGRTIGVISTPGDRRDEDIRELGRIAAEHFDELVFRERPDGRGRTAGGVVALLQEGAIAAGMDPQHIQIVFDESAAMDAALRMAAPEDLVAMTVTDVDGVWRQVQSFRQERVDV